MVKIVAEHLMVALTDQEKDVVDRFRQLPPERQRHVMLAMFGADPDGWKSLQPQGERQLAKLASQRGLDWASMSDEQRQDFVNDLVHEDRP
jgi:hypothetical protein